jgi:F-type H+-transporting ATPase subunit delta
MKGNEQAIADVYAEALLLAAREAGQEDEVAAQLGDLIAYMNKNSDFAAFLTSAAVDDGARQASLDKLFRGEMNDLLVNLLHVLNDRKRGGLIRLVYRSVQLRLAEQRQQQEVFVDTAVSLTDDLRSAIKYDIRKRTGKDPILVERLRPELIGGLVLRIGDMQIDGSVATRMRLIRRRLLERASEEIHKDGQYVAE